MSGNNPSRLRRLRTVAAVVVVLGVVVAAMIAVLGQQQAHNLFSNISSDF